MSDHDVIADFNGEQSNPSTVVDQLTEHAAFSVEDIGNPRRKLAERHRWLEQRIEAFVGEQRYCSSEPAAPSPAWPPRHRHLADLTRDQSQPAAMKRPTERCLNLSVAVPA